MLCTPERSPISARRGRSWISPSPARSPPTWSRRPCAGGVEKAAAKFASAKLKALDKCVNRVFACEDTKPPGGECAAAVAPKCAKDVAVIDKAHLKLRDTIDAKCGAVPLGVLRTADALNLDAAQVDCGTIATLADYEECLFLQHSCRVELMLATDVPLAQELLGSVGVTIAPACL